MENDGINNNSPGTSLQSDSSIPVYPNQPFVTPPQNTSATLRPVSSSPIAVPSSIYPQKSLSTETSAAIPLATGSTSALSSPTGVATQASASTSRPNTIPSPSPQASSPTIGSLQTNEHSDTSVTVDAVPAQSHNSKRPNITENVPPPSQGALIAFGVLTVFFTIMIISLLVWRKRRNSKADKKDALAAVEEASNSSPTGSKEPSEKGSSLSTISRNSEADQSVSKTSGQEDDKEGTSKPFGGRSILRPVRPPSLLIDPRKNSQELNNGRTHQQDLNNQRDTQELNNQRDSQELNNQNNNQEVNARNERELRRMKFDRPNSWRSSIASTWASLGLPSKVLQDTTAQQPWDGASVHSHRSAQNLLHSSFSITEEQSPMEKPNTPSTISDTTRSVNSSTLSSSTFGDVKQRPPSVSRLRHSSTLSSHIEAPHHDSKSIHQESIRRTSLPHSISQSGTLDSHATTSDIRVLSPTHSVSTHTTPSETQLVQHPIPTVL